VTPRRVNVIVAFAGALLAALLIAVLSNSLTWIERSFPGFMVMANRVIPSISLPHWARGQAPELFQEQVAAVNGEPVTLSSEVYAASEGGPGQTVEYRLRSTSGEERSVRVVTQSFALEDYLLLFGAYLWNGLVFAGMGLLVFRLKPRNLASQAFSIATIATAVFVITAADLYGPHWFFRLHVAAEVLVAAGFLHLALVFPTDRIRGRERSALGLIYGTAAAGIAAYEAVLWHPAAYTAAHLAAVAAQGFGCAATIAAIVYDFFASGSPLVRRRIGVVALGATAGMAAPVGLWAASAMLGGRVSLNEAAFTAFLFPLSLAYAVVQRDLFEIDAMLSRATTYFAVIVAIATAYVVALTGFELVVRWSGGTGQRSVLLVFLNVALLFALNPIRARVQATVDETFFRRGYDPQTTVVALGHALEEARDVDRVVASTRRVFGETFWPKHILLLAVGPDGRLRDLAHEEESPARTLASELPELPDRLAARLAKGDVLTRYEWEDGSGRALPEVWTQLDAELLVPLRRGDRLEHVLALGAKESGHAYNIHDSVILQTMAGQVSLALATARAFGDLASLNASLERQVDERTRELAQANGELNESVDRLRDAYERLQRSQTSLVRSDRLATLGRLMAGIAHEVNTPLAALMNALELVEELGGEYAQSIDDPEVNAKDHHEIAAEILATTANAQTWASRAATFIRRVKGHSREPTEAEARPFALSDVLAEIDGLLSHRLQGSGCRLIVDPEAAALQLLGDPDRLTHVFLNLVENAIAAYDEQENPDGRIVVSAKRSSEEVVVTVRDWAGGVPPEIADRIFDELFTTKERGKGTGLGLWIARNLVEEGFQGSLDLVSVEGGGSCFAVRLRQPRTEPGSFRGTAREAGPDPLRS